jgi:hypothetical protein
VPARGNDKTEIASFLERLGQRRPRPIELLKPLGINDDNRGLASAGDHLGRCPSHVDHFAESGLGFLDLPCVARALLDDRLLTSLTR